jgi:hypothetical protein
MAEDFTTWTESDPGSNREVTSSQVVGTAIPYDDPGYVMKTLSEVIGDFQHDFDVYVDGYAGTAPIIRLWKVFESGGSYAELYTAYQYGLVGIILRASGGSSAHAIDLDTWYYCRAERTGDTVTCKVYSDSGRTNLLFTLSTTDDGFEYEEVYILSNMQGNEGDTFTVTVANMDLHISSGPTSVLMTARLGGVRHTFRPGSYRLTLTLGGVTLTPEVMQIEMAIPKTEEPEKPTEPEQKVTVPEKTVPEVTEVVKQITEFDKFTEQVVKQPLPVQMFKGLPLEFWPSSDVATGNSPLLLKAKEDLEKLNKMAMQWIEVPGGAQLIPKEDKRSLWQKITDFFRGK